MKTLEASRARRDDDRGWCQGQTNAQMFGASYASSTWGCQRRPSRKEGDNPRYCWQHQPRGVSGEDRG